jgi:hypothetical protein
MPNTNIVFVKLFWKELLHEDDRFIEQLNDSQKGLYLMLLLLAGATNNNIKYDVNYLKRVLNLHENTQIISQNLKKIFEVFRNSRVINGYIKFKNFNKLHNYVWKRVGNSLGIPKEVLEKNRIEKNRIDRAIAHYIHLKDLKTEVATNHAILTNIYKTQGKQLVELLSVEKDDLEVERAMDWVAGKFKDIDWKFSTVVKQYSDYLRNKNKKVVTYE